MFCWKLCFIMYWFKPLLWNLIVFYIIFFHHYWPASREEVSLLVKYIYLHGNLRNASMQLINFISFIKRIWTNNPTLSWQPGHRVISLFDYANATNITCFVLAVQRMFIWAIQIYFRILFSKSFLQRLISKLLFTIVNTEGFHDCPHCPHRPSLC